MLPLLQLEDANAFRQGKTSVLGTMIEAERAERLRLRDVLERRSLALRAIVARINAELDQVGPCPCPMHDGARLDYFYFGVLLQHVEETMRGNREPDAVPIGPWTAKRKRAAAEREQEQEQTQDRTPEQKRALN